MNNITKKYTMNEIAILLLVGLAAGFLSGMVGVGGGIIVVPALVYFLGFSQHSAQGTTLFMFLFPIGILAVLNYHKAGYVDWKAALFICTKFIAGSYFGSRLSITIDQQTVKKIFGSLIIIMGIKMLLEK